MQLAPLHPGLILAATVLLAITMDPAKRRLQQLANRLVYGHRRSPWEAVRHLSTQMGHDRDPLELLHELSTVVRAGTGASTVVVWLLLDRMWVPTVGSPDIRSGEPIPAAGGDFAALDDIGFSVPVRYGDELLGAITVTKFAPGSLNPLEQRLVADLASHAGIVTQTLHLRESRARRLELSRQQHRVLGASRAQVIAAQDEERRRIERDLHDTCQQQAVILAGRLGLAGALAKRDPAQAHTLIDDACADATRLASSLRRLISAAPISELVDHGVGPALRFASAGLPLTLDIQDRLVRRYDTRLEAAAYFCAMEAIQNATKHAHASRIELRLSESMGCLTIRVRDDGLGFDVERATAGMGLRNIKERLRPWHGHLVINSSSAGTEIVIEIPVETREATS
jgi:signal transduction histidine kinase